MTEERVPRCFVGEKVLTSAPNLFDYLPIRWCLGRGLLLPAESTFARKAMTIFCTQRDSDWNKAIAAQFSLIAGAHWRLSSLTRSVP